jgi:hypothetical protein
MEAYHELSKDRISGTYYWRGTVYNDNVFPTRFGYPPTTVSTNSANVAIALEQMGGPNTLKTPVCGVNSYSIRIVINYY